MWEVAPPTGSQTIFLAHDFWTTDEILVDLIGGGAAKSTAERAMSSRGLERDFWTPLSTKTFPGSLA